MPIVGRINILGTVQETLAVPENHTGSMFDIVQGAYDFTNGGAAGQNNLVWSDARQVGVGANDDIVLTGGGLLDVFGNAVNFSTVTAIVISNIEAVVGEDILVLPHPVNSFMWTFAAVGDAIEVRAVSVYAQWSDTGQTTGGGATTLRITNNGAAAIDYNILIVGRV